MTKCYSCKATIGEHNSSLEHIIPNAIGGRMKSPALLCKACNSAFGSGIDAAFAQAMEPIGAMLNIKRDRRKGNVLKNLKSESGEVFHLVDGRIPVSTKPIIRHEGERIHVKASDMHQLKQIIKGLQRKFPNLDTSRIFDEAKPVKKFLESDLEMPLTIGGEEYYRAIGKIAVNAYLHFGGSINQILPFIEVIKGHRKNEFHIHSSALKNTDTWWPHRVVHSIYIRGCAETGILYAYVVFFSAFAFFVNLSDEYHGQELEISYAYDVLNSLEVNIDANASYSGRKAYAVEVDKNGPVLNQTIMQSLQENITKILRIADEIHINTTQEEILKEALAQFLEKIPDGTVLSESILNQLSQHFIENITPFITHLVKMKERRST